MQPQLQIFGTPDQIDVLAAGTGSVRIQLSDTLLTKIAELVEEVGGSGGAGAAGFADTSHNGLLKASDWRTFNSKQPAGSYVMEAPKDGDYYSRRNAAWEVNPGAGAFGELDGGFAGSTYGGIPPIAGGGA